MRLWIPDIGDKLRLTEDWTFTLWHAGRNGAIWQALDLDKHPIAIAAAKTRADLWERIKVSEKQMVRKRSTQPWMGFIYEWPTPELEAESKELRASFDALSEVSIPVTFPKSTELTVDRVYIRKGASEFSSLTFFIGDSPMKELMPVKKGGSWPSGQRRFWAKLADVNRIEFEPL
jgi:hypothetical protein